MSAIVMAGDRALEKWNRGDTAVLSNTDEEKGTERAKNLSHSIEAILRRPMCEREERRIHYNCSVIKEKTSEVKPPSSTGIYHNK